MKKAIDEIIVKKDEEIEVRDLSELVNNYTYVKKEEVEQIRRSREKEEQIIMEVIRMKKQVGNTENTILFH